MSKAATQLGPYFDAYIERRSDLGWQTIQTLQQTRRAVMQRFGPSMSMADITIGDAKDHRLHLSKTLAQATVAMHVKKLRQVWRDAIDRRLLTENPWKSVKAGSQTNSSRQFYVPVADVLKVIEHCQNHEWKMLFALARFAGMRIPSEPRLLKWTDINFGDDIEAKILIHSQKTKHHPGKDTRFMPLLRAEFPDLERILLDGLGKTDEGAIYVLPRLRLHKNFHKAAIGMIERAGVKPWPKLWNNLRSSCETDLAIKHPLHVVCAFMGNSVSIAQKHYLQVTDDQYLLANAGMKRRSGKGQITIPKTSETYLSKCPLQGSLPPGTSEKIVQAAAGAIHSLYRRKLRELKRFDMRSLRYLGSEVRAARRRAGGGA